MDFLLLFLLVICIIQLHGLSQRMAKLEKQNILPKKNASAETPCPSVRRETQPVEILPKTSLSDFNAPHLWSIHQLFRRIFYKHELFYHLQLQQTN